MDLPNLHKLLRFYNKVRFKAAVRSLQLNGESLTAGWRRRDFATAAASYTLRSQRAVVLVAARIHIW
jgi:hypothetical protein